MYIREIMQKPDFKCNYCIGNVSLKCSIFTLLIVQTLVLNFCFNRHVGKNATLNHISEPMWKGEILNRHAGSGSVSTGRT